MYSVLLVDQNSHSRTQIKNMIDWKQHGFSISASIDEYAKVTPIIRRNQYSLVLINMRGFQSGSILLCQRIRKKSKVPIILLGGDDDFRLARKAITYQVRDYLAAPIQTSELAESLKAVKLELDSLENAKPEANSHPFDTPLKEPIQSSESIIDLVKGYVQQQLHENVTLKKISDLMHFNSSYLGQKFKTQENMTFNDYLLQQRMEKAKILLEKTDMRVYEIANEIGYTEIDWFYKKFKEYTGSSANEYRKHVSETA
ncbi:helix-turn-helix domain-containing protein [Paenibacillus sp. LHD-117]|uniref:response regulator transcription factor n=1 Tax=Paenibacillus sp. LHD-117 TaxID=3071412 RepID=UPI0027E1973F|nr:helix-turn-helix domain-containing protein [Paenibacillus sp. LHD-117]MDQ6417858.1 helix-turn-helix domain-containing protein [Paenibacillus sp. LHD-117]